MKKTIFWIFMAAMAVAAQTSFPRPAGISSGMYDSTVQACVNIGDFDGDGSDDLALIWNGPMQSFFTIYSIKKATYLVIDTSNQAATTSNNSYYKINITTGHLSAGSTPFVVAGSRYYIWNGSPILKKKAQQ